MNISTTADRLNTESINNTAKKTHFSNHITTPPHPPHSSTTLIDNGATFPSYTAALAASITKKSAYNPPYFPGVICNPDKLSHTRPQVHKTMQ